VADSVSAKPAAPVVDINLAAASEKSAEAADEEPAADTARSTWRNAAVRSAVAKLPWAVVLDVVVVVGGARGGLAVGAKLCSVLFLMDVWCR
jgi:hypothetical protein